MRSLITFTSSIRKWTLEHPTGRTLILVVVIKLAIMFLVLRLFFFPDILQSRFSNDRDRSQHVLDQITNRK